MRYTRRFDSSLLSKSNHRPKPPLLVSILNMTIPLAVVCDLVLVRSSSAPTRSRSAETESHILLTFATDLSFVGPKYGKVFFGPKTQTRRGR